jgi:hypothetical protein
MDCDDDESSSSHENNAAADIGFQKLKAWML